MVYMHTVYTVHAVHTVHTVHTVHAVHTVHTVHTVHAVHAVHTVHAYSHTVVLYIVNSRDSSHSHIICHFVEDAVYLQQFDLQFSIAHDSDDLRPRLDTYCKQSLCSYKVYAQSLHQITLCSCSLVGWREGERG